MSELDAEAALNTALAEAQGEFPALKRERTVSVETRSGGSYEFSYAPLEAILPVVRPILAKHGLSVVQLLEPGPSLRTELRHAKGGVVGGTFPFGAPESPQALGSMLTYLRRYALVALLGLASEHDDDGNEAAAAMISPDQHAKIGAVLAELERKRPTQAGEVAWVDALRQEFGVVSRSELTQVQASEAIEWLNAQLTKPAQEPFVTPRGERGAGGEE